MGDMEDKEHIRHENWLRLESLTKAYKITRKTDIDEIIHEAKKIERYVLNVPEVRVIKMVKDK